MTGRVQDSTQHLNGSQRSILVVDPSASVLTLVKAVLEGRGHRVLVAHNAEAAMRLAAQPRLRIDYLMTNTADPQAPEVAARILDARPEVEMLFMSAVKDPDAIRIRMIDDGSAAPHKEAVRRRATEGLPPKAKVASISRA